MSTKVDPIMLVFPDEFHSERLTIRSPRPGDGPALREALAESLPELRDWLPWARAPLPTVEECEAQVRQAHVDFLARQDLRLHLYLKGTMTQIGGSGLHRIDWDVPRFEIGYWLRTPFVGHGYMTEAVTAITDFAFRQLAARRVEIRVDPCNERSVTLPARAGYILEGRLRNQLRDPDTRRLRDTLIFARTADDPE